MTTVTFQALEGVDKGRIFRDLPVAPFLTIGREEGNQLRLNDERVSRFHAKIQQDNGDIVLTDLDSTNGTRVNGNDVQIRRLRVGDRISIGRSVLLFGSNEEIAARLANLMAAQPGSTPSAGASAAVNGPATIQAPGDGTQLEQELEFDLNLQAPVTAVEGNLFVSGRPLPPLPQRLTPAQAARLAEILDFMHRGLATATENLRANEEGSEVLLSYADWQRVLAVQMLLGRYLRAVSEPDVLQQ